MILYYIKEKTVTTDDNNIQINDYIYNEINIITTNELYPEYETEQDGKGRIKVISRNNMTYVKDVDLNEREEK